MPDGGQIRAVLVRTQDEAEGDQASCTCRTWVGRTQPFSRLVEAGTLRSLRVQAAHSSPRLQLSCLAASGLQHLSLECHGGLRLEGECDDRDSPPVPSIHLFTWVRSCDADLGANLGADSWRLTTR